MLAIVAVYTLCYLSVQSSQYNHIIRLSQQMDAPFSEEKKKMFNSFMAQCQKPTYRTFMVNAFQTWLKKQDPVPPNDRTEQNTPPNSSLPQRASLISPHRVFIEDPHRSARSPNPRGGYQHGEPYMEQMVQRFADRERRHPEGQTNINLPVRSLESNSHAQRKWRQSVNYDQQSSNHGQPIQRHNLANLKAKQEKKQEYFAKQIRLLLENRRELLQKIQDQSDPSLILTLQKEFSVIGQDDPSFFQTKKKQKDAKYTYLEVKEKFDQAMGEYKVEKYERDRLAQLYSAAEENLHRTEEKLIDMKQNVNERYLEWQYAQLEFECQTNSLILQKWENTRREAIVTFQKEDQRIYSINGSYEKGLQIVRQIQSSPIIKDRKNINKPLDKQDEVINYLKSQPSQFYFVTKKSKDTPMNQPQNYLLNQDRLKNGNFTTISKRGFENVNLDDDVIKNTSQPIFKAKRQEERSNSQHKVSYKFITRKEGRSEDNLTQTYMNANEVYYNQSPKYQEGSYEQYK